MLAVYTALRPGRSTAVRAGGVGRPPRRPRRDRALRRSSARRPPPTPSEGCSVPEAPRSARFASRAGSELRRETLISPWAELGLVAADGPNDPEPELVVEDGRVTRLDGRAAADFDVIDRFLVAHGLDLEVAAEAMALPDAETRAAARRRRRSARGARAAGARPDPGQARASDRPARPGGADVRAQEAARAPGAGQPGARDEPQGEPGAARRRRRRGRPAWLRRDRDDGRRRPLRAAQRARAARRLPDRAAGGDDAVRRGGASQPRARHPRPRHLRGDALGVRDRVGVRRRRRHAVVEGVPRRRVRVARREGAVHVGHRLGGADGVGAGLLDALPRGALRLRGAGGRRAGRAERLHLVRRARALRARRHARDPGRERARRLARPRGRVRERRHRVAFGDPQDGEADGAVPAGHRLRHLRLLGHAASRQHVRRRQLRRRRHRRMADDATGLAGRRRHRAGRGGRGAARARARRPRGAGGVRRAGAAADHRRGGRRGDRRLRLERPARP